MILLYAACSLPPPDVRVHTAPWPQASDTAAVETEPRETSGPETETDPPDSETGGHSVPEWVGPVVRINEVMTDNDSVVSEPGLTPGDWFELYNPEAEPLDLGRVEITASGSSWRGSGTLAAGGTLLVWAGTYDDPTHASLGLSRDGETLTARIDGVEVDRLDVPAVGQDLSWARYPDGGSPAATIWPTPGFTNGRDPGSSTDPTDVLFQTDIVWTIDLTLSDAAIRALDADPYTDVEGSFSFRGVTWTSVAIRKKGVYGSLRGMSQKVALKVDLDEYGGNELRGLEHLSINNMVQDPSYIHELLTYTLVRAAGMPAPRVGYVWMRLNGEDYGLYLLVETPDDDFLARWYTDPTGPLYEGAYGVDFYVGSEGAFEYDEGPDPNDRSDLTELATHLNRDPGDPANYVRLRGLFDMDQFHRLMAIEALALHWDGYTTANNYRVYHDPSTDLFTMIPWGSDQTWVDDWYDAYGGYGRLHQWCLQSPDCRTDYNAAQIEIADLLDTLPHEDLMDSVLAGINDEITRDPKREFDLGWHANRVDATRARIQAGPDDIRGSIR